MKKVYIEGNGFPQIAGIYRTEGFEIVTNHKEADIIQFGGGADVSPEYYGHPLHDATYKDGARDKYCEGLFDLSKDKLKVGICRGAQFLHVMNGGVLSQDIKGHAIGGTHAAYFRNPEKDFEKSIVQVTSTHHQQLIRNNEVQHDLLMYSVDVGYDRTMYCEESGKFYVEKQAATPRHEVESVFYPHQKTLCFQPHPEYVKHDHPCNQAFLSALRYAIAQSTS